MGLIVKSLEVVGEKGKREVRALFDTGASASFVRRDIAAQVAAISKLPSSRTFILGDGRATLKVPEAVILDITIEGVTIFHPLMVTDAIAEEMIVGADMLQRWKIKLDPEKEEVFIDKRVTELKLV